MLAAEMEDKMKLPDHAIRSHALAPNATQSPRDAALKMVAAAVPGLAQALGSNSEVLLHDLSLIPNSIVAIGGNLTGRSAGGPVTDLLLRNIRQGRTENILDYRTKHSDGRTFRSSTVFLRDENDAPFACLCINTDITAWEQARDLLDGYVGTPRSPSFADASGSELDTD